MQDKEQRHENTVSEDFGAAVKRNGGRSDGENKAELTHNGSANNSDTHSQGSIHVGEASALCTNSNYQVLPRRVRRNAVRDFFAHAPGRGVSVCRVTGGVSSQSSTILRGSNEFSGDAIRAKDWTNTVSAARATAGCTERRRNQTGPQRQTHAASPTAQHGQQQTLRSTLQTCASP
jgi:hypothetical protein